MEERRKEVPGRGHSLCKNPQGKPSGLLLEMQEALSIRFLVGLHPGASGTSTAGDRAKAKPQPPKGQGCVAHRSYSGLGRWSPVQEFQVEVNSEELPGARGSHGPTRAVRSWPVGLARDAAFSLMTSATLPPVHQAILGPSTHTPAPRPLQPPEPQCPLGALP